MPILVIAKYHCEVAGEPTESLDYRVRYFDADSIEEVMTRLRSDKPTSYTNIDGQTVSWCFDDTVAVEYEPKLEDGKEVIGFITGRATKAVE